VSDSLGDGRDRYRSPRLDQDVFQLTPWARGNNDGGRRNGRRNSTRATVDDAPSETGDETATLTDFDGDGQQQRE